MQNTELEDAVDVHIHVGGFVFLFAKFKAIKQSIFVIYSVNLAARTRDPLMEESWGSGKKPKRMHGTHCIPLLLDPVH